VHDLRLGNADQDDRLVMLDELRPGDAALEIDADSRATCRS